MNVRKPPNEWDDDLELEESLDIDEHELDFKLGLDRIGKSTMRPINIASVPREEGEGFVEDMEARMDKLTISEILKENEQNDDDMPYDPEDLYGDAEFADEDEYYDDSDDEEF
jgi:hypothetical protein